VAVGLASDASHQAAATAVAAAAATWPHAQPDL